MAKWVFQTNMWIRSSPAIGSDGTLYIGSYDNNLYALADSNDAPVSETLTVNNPTTTGFTLGLSPALNGLTKSDFILHDSLNNAVSITSAATMDNGATYAIIAALTVGKTYTITAEKNGYNFGIPANVFVQLMAKSVIQIGVDNKDGENVGIYVGLDNIVDSNGNTIYDFNVATFNIEVDFDPAKVTVLDVVNETNSGQFTKTIEAPGKVTVTYTSATGMSNFNKLFFIPITLTGSVLDTTSLQVKYLSVTDINHNQIYVENPSAQVFQRSKILNEGLGTLPSINDAVAGLQYLAGLRNAGTDSGHVNLINMASIVGPDTDSTVIKQNVKDIIALMQYLAGLRDDSFMLILQ